MSDGGTRAAGPFDWFTEMNEQLDRTNELLRRQTDLLEQLLVATPSAEPGVEAFPFEFSTSVPADTTRDSPVTVDRTVPVDVRVTTVVLGWRDGADGQVGIQFGTEAGERYLPRNSEDEYVAFNDFSHAFTVRTEVSEGTTLRAKMVNLDATNAHQANVVAELEFLENPLADPEGRAFLEGRP